jgi:hypothetical protein
MERFAAMVHRREPLVDDVIGFMDGLSIPCACSSEQKKQSSYYNGYYSDTTVANVFAFGPDGKIFLACINFPGSWHNSNVVSPILERLKERLDGKKICVDQGFPRQGFMEDVLVGPISQRQAELLSDVLRNAVIQRSNVYTSLRQASEWGMRSLQGGFCRLKARLPSDENKRHDIIEAIVLLHNFRTHHEGCNQITTVFSDDYQEYCNLDGYERIRRFFKV